MQAVKDAIPLNPAAANLENMRAQAKAIIEPVVDALDKKYEIPDEKIEAVIDYTVQYFAKHHRTMKPDRMTRKIAEYFHLKPKANESNQVPGDQRDPGGESAAV